MEEKDKQPTVTKVGKISCLVGIIIVCLTAVVIAVHKIGSEKSFVKINTPYIELRLPSALESVITYDESTCDDVYTCVFSLNYAGEELPLWRFDFG